MQEICYLCGKQINKKDMTADHVPPKQIFPSRLRKNFKLNLRTLCTHRVCNEEYKRDEDYFKFSIGAADDSNPILKEVWRDMQSSVSHPETMGLRNMIFKEFISEVRTDAGLILPNIVAKSFDQKKIGRVIWKITRGLFLIEFDRFLPEKTIHATTYAFGRSSGRDSEITAKIFEIVLAQPERSAYGRIFAYKYRINPQEKNCAAWAFLFWDRHMFLAVHHDPDCDCKKCVEKKNRPKTSIT